MVDDALDATEAVGVAPRVAVTLEPDALVVADNGPGISGEIVRGVADFSVLVSTNSRYVSPSRGQLGNALKTVVGAAFIVGEERGWVEFIAGGTRHRIDARVDAVRQQPVVVDHATPPPPRVSEVKNGTVVRVGWPGTCTSLLAGSAGADFSVGALRPAGPSVRDDESPSRPDHQPCPTGPSGG